MDQSPKSNDSDKLKSLAFKAGVGVTAVGVLVSPTGVPGIILMVLGVLSLAYSGYFARFFPGNKK